MKFVIAISFLGIAFSSISMALPNEISVPIRMDEKRKFYKVDNYPLDNISKVKIAILDNGFTGFEPGKGTLPENTQLIPTYDEAFRKAHSLPLTGGDELAKESQHGHIMAQIVWHMAGKKPEGPQFFLLNAKGGTNYRAAIKYAVYEAKADIILSSMNWEGVGNYDGKGYLNDYVSEATAAGVLWVNAAGNYGGRVFDSQYYGTDNNGFLMFAEKKNRLRIKSRVKGVTTDISLSYTADWSSAAVGTKTDLDLHLYDDKDNLIASSRSNQKHESEGSLKEGETALARETISYDQFEFDKEYTLAIRLKRGTMSPTDRFRVVVVPGKPAIKDTNTGELHDVVELMDAMPGREIMIPADNKTVIAVGDLESYSATGPTTDGRTKPDLLMEDSVVSYDTGNSERGTSQAAALFAGILSVLKARNPQLDRERVLQFVTDKARLPAEVDPALMKLSNFPLMHMPEFFAKIVQAAKKAFPGQPLMAGKYTSGRFALGVPEEPSDFILRLCGEKPTHRLEAFRHARKDSEYYVTPNRSDLRKSNPSCYGTGDHVCCVRTPGVGKAVYPWQHFNEEPTRFLHIRMQGIVSDGLTNGQTPMVEVIKARVWKTPEL